MLNNDKLDKLKEDIEWAKLQAEKGNVYNITWAKKYAEDVQMLMDQILGWESPTVMQLKLQEHIERAIHESKKS